MVLAGVAVADKGKAPRKKAKAAEKAPPPEAVEPPAEAVEEAPPVELPAHIVGPKLVDLGHGAEIDLPAGMLLFERTVAQELMRKAGNDADSVIAAILPAGEGTWMVVIESDDVGYVSDDDADDLDASAMLEQYKVGTIEQNKTRKSMGILELYIDGWSEPPRYERLKRHLVWGLNAHDSEGKTVNFFTRFLGRNGYLSVNLIDDPVTIDAAKLEALSILTALRFKPGQRYDDHVDGDKDSGIGLKALILGGTGLVVAKKTGILIAILLFFKKGFIIVLAAIGGFFRWLTGKKKKGEPTVDPTSPEPPHDPNASPPAGPAGPVG